ncbi:MAG TPA: lysylphosphatidylglycerol synthase domain-containing protein, partial [Chloroflexota bacterium]|nr:lysylphosphatidylglycerol synthase domain-containing protein [Chloroflexota bacterium]
MKARFGRIIQPTMLLPALLIAIGLVVAIVGLSSIKVALTLAIQNGILTPWILLSLLPFTMLSYGLRALRWHFLVRRLAPSIRLVESIYSQIVGFAFSPTPGRVAELYKLKVIERWAEQPAVRFLPAVVVERLSDVVGFALLAVVGSIFSWSSVIVGQRTVVM